MKRTWIIASMAGAAALAAIVAAEAAPWGAGGPGCPGGRFGQCIMGPGAMRWLDAPDILEEAGVSDEQVEALRELHDAAQKEAIRLRADAQIASVEVRSLLRGASPDEAAVREAIEAAGRARIAWQQHLASSMLEARRLVGEDTWQALTSRIREEMRVQWQDRRGRRGPRRWGPGAGLGRGPQAGLPPWSAMEDGADDFGPVF